MKVARNYICNGCSKKWRVVFNERPSNDKPVCPECGLGKIETSTFDPSAGKAPAYGGSMMSKAVDETYKMAERDYGMTDMRDNLRQGDIAMKIPSNPVGDALQKQGGMFSQHSMQGHGGALSLASAAKSERKSQNISDPVAAFQTGLKVANTPSVIDAARSGPIGIRGRAR